MRIESFLRRNPAPTGWQPISTAKRDNVPVWLFVPGLQEDRPLALGNMTVGVWVPSVGTIIFNDGTVYTNGSWQSDLTETEYEGELDEHTYSVALNPTHWMSLPAPPPVYLAGSTP